MWQSNDWKFHSSYTKETNLFLKYLKLKSPKDNMILSKTLNNISKNSRTFLPSRHEKCKQQFWTASLCLLLLHFWTHLISSSSAIGGWSRNYKSFYKQAVFFVFVYLFVCYFLGGGFFKLSWYVKDKIHPVNSVPAHFDFFMRVALSHSNCSPFHRIISIGLKQQSNWPYSSVSF